MEATDQRITDMMVLGGELNSLSNLFNKGMITAGEYVSHATEYANRVQNLGVELLEEGVGS